MELLPDSPELATRADLRSLQDRLDARFTEIDPRFEKIDRLPDFHETLRSYARTFVIAQTATVFGVSGIFFGITQLM